MERNKEPEAPTIADEIEAQARDKEETRVAALRRRATRLLIRVAVHERRAERAGIRARDRYLRRKTAAPHKDTGTASTQPVPVQSLPPSSLTSSAEPVDEQRPDLPPAQPADVPSSSDSPAQPVAEQKGEPQKLSWQDKDDIYSYRFFEGPNVYHSRNRIESLEKHVRNMLSKLREFARRGLLDAVIENGVRAGDRLYKQIEGETAYCTVCNYAWEEALEIIMSDIAENGPIPGFNPLRLFAPQVNYIRLSNVLQREKNSEGVTKMLACLRNLGEESRESQRDAIKTYFTDFYFFDEIQKALQIVKDDIRVNGTITEIDVEGILKDVYPEFEARDATRFCLADGKMDGKDEFGLKQLEKGAHIQTDRREFILGPRLGSGLTSIVFAARTSLYNLSTNVVLKFGFLKHIIEAEYGNLRALFNAIENEPKDNFPGKKRIYYYPLCIDFLQLGKGAVLGTNLLSMAVFDEPTRRQEKGFSIENRIKYGLQIGHAFAVAEGAGILNDDIKDSMFRLEGDNVVIIDWNMTRNLDYHVACEESQSIYAVINGWLRAFAGLLSHRNPIGSDHSLLVEFNNYGEEISPEEIVFVRKFRTAVLKFIRGEFKTVREAYRQTLAIFSDEKFVPGADTEDEPYQRAFKEWDSKPVKERIKL